VDLHGAAQLGALVELAEQTIQCHHARVLADAVLREDQRMVTNAEKRIEQETARALQQIRAEAVEISVAIASKILQRNVSAQDNERLIEETFKQIESTQRPS
jgi:F-type H+-transporting ATPase subunit b